MIKPLSNFGINQYNIEMMFAFLVNTANSFDLGKVLIIMNPTVIECLT